jgi:cyclopropane fatty-acyl-phospholipid synthase-like methyltransferase
MQLATGNNMLNFGYWKNHAIDPKEAQNKLCELIGNIADMESARTVLDVGSGFSAPAFYWKSQYVNINITCINTNFQQLLFATNLVDNDVSEQKTNFSLLRTNDVRFVNATSTSLPFANNSVDRIIALESAQHFKPLDQFIRESKRVLRKEGLFIIAIPVIKKVPVKSSLFMKLGILSLTWASEHYSLDYIKSAIINKEFNINEIQSIGSYVYDPLADYYMKNRKHIRERILKKYPSYLENILHKSLLKMKEVSQKGIIDYIIIKCTAK